MSLLERQQAFCLNIHFLIEHAYKNGYAMVITGIGKLSIDFDIYKEGKLIEDSSLIAPLGEFWIDLHTDNIWNIDKAERFERSKVDLPIIVKV